MELIKYLGLGTILSKILVEIGTLSGVSGIGIIYQDADFEIDKEKIKKLNKYYYDIFSNVENEILRVLKIIDDENLDLDLFNKFERFSKEIGEKKTELNDLLDSKNELDFSRALDYESFRNKFLNLRDMTWDVVNKIKVVQLKHAGNYNPEKMLKGASSFFTDDIWKNLTKNEKEDLEDCVYCLLTGCWTPGGMIALRSVESRLRQFYKFKTQLQEENWQNILNKLKKMPDIDESLIGYLEFIKEKRNKLAHPEERLNSSESDDIFMHSVYILKILVKEMLNT